MYDGIDIILATKHQKELALQASFATAFNAKIIVPTDYDTDQFGTFTGEIERSHRPDETVVLKAKNAAVQYGYHFGLASEGSFGPHPAHYFSPCDFEWLCFVDLTRDLVIIESDLTTETNYAYLDIKPADSYQNFLEQVKFGSHALILRGMTTHSILAKGVQTQAELHQLIARHFQREEVIRLETDMRAMFNPTRMRFIERLGAKLIARINTPCQQCCSPGFGKVSVEGCLPCADCLSETGLYEHRVLSCVKCDYKEAHPRLDGLLNADPQYCFRCNP
jgi:hypothetical protein